MEHKELLQAITDAFTGLTIAVARQVDGQQLATDLRELAAVTADKGKPVSAGLLLEMADMAESGR